MVYQFSSSMLPSVIGTDVILMVLLYSSTVPEKKATQRLIYGMVIMGFLGFSLLKLPFTVPAPLASAPADLEVKTDEAFTTLYYLAENRGKPEVFWKDVVTGRKADRYFEMESNVKNGLLVARKIDGNVGYQRVDLKNAPFIIDVRKESFDFEKNEAIRQAISQYRWTEYGNYLSHLLMVVFLGMLVWRVIKFEF